MVARLLLTASLIALTACSERPQAPALTRESVYRNDAIGLRFMVPAGWWTQSRASLPSGPLSRPIVLVSYQGGVERPAQFRVVIADAPAEANLQQLLIEHPVGPEKWTAQSPMERVEINGAEASRFVLTRVEGKDEFRREVTAFRRGQRVFFFLVDFAASDAASRDAVRTAIGSVTWKK